MGAFPASYGYGYSTVTQIRALGRYGAITPNRTKRLNIMVGDYWSQPALAWQEAGRGRYLKSRPEPGKQIEVNDRSITPSLQS